VNAFHGNGHQNSQDPKANQAPNIEKKPTDISLFPNIGVVEVNSTSDNLTKQQGYDRRNDNILPGWSS
jgi:hypothetical protein